MRRQLNNHSLPEDLTAHAHVTPVILISLALSGGVEPDGAVRIGERGRQIDAVLWLLR